MRAWQDTCNPDCADGSTAALYSIAATARQAGFDSVQYTHRLEVSAEQTADCTLHTTLHTAGSHRTAAFALSDSDRYPRSEQGVTRQQGLYLFEIQVRHPMWLLARVPPGSGPYNIRLWSHCNARLHDVGEHSRRSVMHTSQVRHMYHVIMCDTQDVRDLQSHGVCPARTVATHLRAGVEHTLPCNCTGVNNVLNCVQAQSVQSCDATLARLCAAERRQGAYACDLCAGEHMHDLTGCADMVVTTWCTHAATRLAMTVTHHLID